MKLISLILSLSIGTTLLAKPKLWVTYEPSLFGGGTVHSLEKKSKEFDIWSTTDITKFVDQNPTALGYAEKTNDYRFKAQVWFWAGVVGGYAVMLGSIPLASSDIISTSDMFAMVLFGGALSIASVFFMESSEKTSRHYMFKAINEYNGVKTEPKVSQRRKITFCLSKIHLIIPCYW